jgi:hypothetical protein
MLIHWYITGYCEASAVFTYSRSGSSYTLFFSIKQTKENEQTLKDIQQFFGFIGKIYEQGPSVVFRVNKIDELKRIVEHFDNYPLQNKKKSAVYVLWRQMVAHKLENYRDIEFDKLKNLAEKISSVNSRDRQVSRIATAV